MNTVDLNRLASQLVAIYKFEYDCGFIGVADVKSYVDMHIIKPSDFKDITGQEYVAG